MPFLKFLYPTHEFLRQSDGVGLALGNRLLFRHVLIV